MNNKLDSEEKDLTQKEFEAEYFGDLVFDINPEIELIKFLRDQLPFYFEEGYHSTCTVLAKLHCDKGLVRSTRKLLRDHFEHTNGKYFIDEDQNSTDYFYRPTLLEPRIKLIESFLESQTTTQRNDKTHKTNNLRKITKK